MYSATTQTRQPWRPAAIGPDSRGVWLMGNDVDVARRLAGAGFDWVALDAQHGAIDRSALVALGRALADVGTNFVVRVPGVEHSWIGASLDAGAAGVIVPSVASVQDARAAVRATYYPPLGERSWGPFSPMWDAAPPPTEEADAQVQCAVMIETAGALEAVEEIAALDGVGMLFLGPVDLSLALDRSVADLLSDTRDEAPVPRIRRAAERHRKAVAAFAGHPDGVPAMRAQGIDRIAVATDIAIVALGAQRALALTDQGRLPQVTSRTKDTTSSST
ncbi:4-hydroxy-2-oxoheptanedioate aldolase [Marihabitans asiaticum]|uniref:4-hydroxy-2-oxoheptanedioate aldolase n=1 Tax=Marihabitans asiaticum TaxID=415218 RepID=A0A560WEZ7_9MICO|nr:aldolase/citrate lyase family protein [Marihabitans asiaticum]TWD16065.1 4-hydroxy-2-oxoheptanedioate aldolase [Marihabitans asiaticum]